MDRGGMTALAGSIPRMMRPTLAQNYPRSGFPLEGKASRSAPQGPTGCRWRTSTVSVLYQTSAKKQKLLESLVKNYNPN